ncbi:hypothetical protein BD309DRAFT_882160 [Dichomitus squalens]|nr:hypothetical protein BD309DRAFT_882160 [Dichomitus squalens]
MVFGFWSQPAGKTKEPATEGKLPSEPTKPSAEAAQPARELKPAGEAATLATSGNGAEVPTQEAEPVPSAGEQSSAPADPEPRPPSQKRFSWRILVQPKSTQDRKHTLPPAREEAEKEARARQEYIERKMVRTRSERRARDSALLMRELIVGPFAVPSAALPKSSKVAVTAASNQKVHKVKAQLLEPKQANKVIAQLRQLPSSDVPVVVGKTSAGEDIKALSKGPIHAVCLPMTDAEADVRHFAKLDKVEVAVPSPSASGKPSPKSSPPTVARNLDLTEAVSGITSVTATSLAKLTSVFKDVDVVSLLTVPNWGLGQPGDQPGILSGAVPSAKAVIEGVEEITPQLMALGYATGKSILPSHDGVFPPTDRMSVLTYWWGLELVVPEPSVKFLSNAPSVAHTVVNFLTALSVGNGGVAEILPFVRYFSTYIDMEFNQIRSQDRGKGVVCAATWIMPAALVPRPWDFPEPPVNPSPPPSAPSAPAPGAGAIVPTSSLPTHDSTPVLVAPLGAAAITSESVPGNQEQGVPGVTVTPPTPPASESLIKSVGAAAAGLSEEAADKVDENGIAAVGQAGAKTGVMNGVPIAAVSA